METNISQTSGSLLINTEERKDLHLFTSNFPAFGGHWKLLSWHLQIGRWKMTSKWLTKFPKLNSTRAGPFSNEKEGGYEKTKRWKKTLATSAIISPFNKSAFPVPFIYGGSFRNYNWSAVSLYRLFIVFPRESTYHLALSPYRLC